MSRVLSELLRLGVAAGVFLSTVILMTLLQMVSDRLYSISIIVGTDGSPPNKASKVAPLEDLFFSVLPNMVQLRTWLPDVLLIALVALGVATCVCFPQRRRIEHQQLVVARRILLILSILYLIRSISFVVTTVPSPINDCKPVYVKNGEFDDLMLQIVRLASGKLSACTDNIYSGHTTLATVLALSMIQYSGIPWMQLYAPIHASAVVIAIILTRLHYTVDVFIAIVISTLVYYLYHLLILTYVDTLILKDKNTIETHVVCYEERRLILRIVCIRLLKVVAWIDGIDKRAALD
jgi:hypothetical protein